MFLLTADFPPLPGLAMVGRLVSLLRQGFAGQADHCFLVALIAAYASLITSANGAVAQLVEHHVRNVGVGGSNPLCSILFIINRLQLMLALSFIGYFPLETTLETT